jgi:hypothetical protein
MNVLIVAGWYHILMEVDESSMRKERMLMEQRNEGSECRG